MQVILNKVDIPREGARVSRARLLKRLDESLNSCTSTIIASRAGTGKTMLAKDFARHCGRKVSWYKVDASDGELHIFFRYLIESVSRQCPGIGHEALAHLASSPSLEAISTLAEAFIYELQEHQGEPLLIVIDDLHLIYDAEWVVPFFRRLLPLLPWEAHVLIIGRTLPPAPLWRMRSKQTLCLVEESDLAFTSQEAENLFASYGLSGADALAALEQSQGRASILDKIARRMSGTGDAAAHHVPKKSSPHVAGGGRERLSNNRLRPRASGR